MWQRSHSCTRTGLPDMLPVMTWRINQTFKCRVSILQGWLGTTHYAWVPVTLILLQIFRIEGYVASGLYPSSAVSRSTRCYIFWKLDLARDLLSWFLAMAVSNHVYLRVISLVFSQVISCVWEGHEKALKQISLPTEFCLFSFSLVCMIVYVCVHMNSILLPDLAVPYNYIRRKVIK
jgi:hypothetical protein